MQYIIFDLEWNTAYSKKHKKNLNEIIEIGALKLDSGLNVLDTFSCLVEMEVGKELQGFVKDMTGLTSKTLKDGVPFSKAYSLFSHWIGEKSTFLSWSVSDIHAFLENIEYFGVGKTIQIMSEHVDIQAYFQSRVGFPKQPQIALDKAYIMVNAHEIEHEQTHRAVDDCYMSFACFKHVFTHKTIVQFTRTTNDEFYARLLFKSYCIKDVHSPAIDRRDLVCSCDVCGGRCNRQSNWQAFRQRIQAYFYCPECRRSLLYAVRFKQLFDNLEVRKYIYPSKEKEGE